MNYVVRSLLVWKSREKRDFLVKYLFYRFPLVCALSQITLHSLLPIGDHIRWFLLLLFLMHGHRVLFHNITSMDDGPNRFIKHSQTCGNEWSVILNFFFHYIWPQLNVSFSKKYTLLTFKFTLSGILSIWNSI